MGLRHSQSGCSKSLGVRRNESLTYNDACGGSEVESKQTSHEEGNGRLQNSEGTHQRSLRGGYNEDKE
ncbi:hypothetical protein CHS0354_004379 [Potamilus streckersoni]|uniref:Uncharacterized protein n=1 Tax=Potamilus streckersoni TaxID=2493646 RepID=A0AAE0SZZ5_9BIVA|nr:hypothetical protein CHS0354_004379 [Potamilus streckersoni]